MVKDAKRYRQYRDIVRKEDKTPDEVNFLIKGLDSRYPEIRYYSALGLSLSNYPSRASIFSSFEKEDLDDWLIGSVKLRKTEADLTEFDKAYLKAQLFKTIGSDHRSIRSVALYWINRLEGPAGLENMLHDRSAGVREEAFFCLRKNLDRETIESFLSREDDYKLREEIGQFLTPQRKKISKGLADKIKGAIFGCAIGDALGAPIESSRLEEVIAKYGSKISTYQPNARRENRKGEFTDDTESALILLDSIAESGYFSPRDYSQKMCYRVTLPMDIGQKINIGYGQSIFRFRRVYAGQNWRFIGDNGSIGCGAAMRVYPISILHHDSLERTKEEAITQAYITHKPALALASSVAVAAAVHIALNSRGGIKQQDFIREIEETVSGMSDPYSSELSRLNQLLQQDAEPEDIIHSIPARAKKRRLKAKKADGVSIAALYSFLRTPDDFRQTVINAVNHSGDSDSVGAVAGAISGAYIGYSKIPTELIDGLAEKAVLQETYERFERAMLC